MVALDASGIAEDARAIAAANGLEGVVTVLRGKAEEADVAAAVASAATVATARGSGGGGGIPSAETSSACVCLQISNCLKAVPLQRPIRSVWMS